MTTMYRPKSLGGLSDSRSRTSPKPSRDGSIHELSPRKHRRALDLDELRRRNELKLQGRFESIFAKYGYDFGGTSDVIDLVTGELIVNNGHLQNMRHDRDVGDQRRRRSHNEMLAQAGRFGDADDELASPSHRKTDRPRSHGHSKKYASANYFDERHSNAPKELAADVVQSAVPKQKAIDISDPSFLESFNRNIVREVTRVMKRLQPPQAHVRECSTPRRRQDNVQVMSSHSRMQSEDDGNATPRFNKTPQPFPLYQDPDASIWEPRRDATPRYDTIPRPFSSSHRDISPPTCEPGRGATPTFDTTPRTLPSLRHTSPSVWESSLWANEIDTMDEVDDAEMIDDTEAIDAPQTIDDIRGSAPFIVDEPDDVETTEGVRSYQQPFSKEEDRLLIHLRIQKRLTLPQICERMNDRSLYLIRKRARQLSVQYPGLADSIRPTTYNTWSKRRARSSAEADSGDRQIDSDPSSKILYEPSTTTHAEYRSPSEPSLPPERSSSTTIVRRRPFKASNDGTRARPKSGVQASSTKHDMEVVRTDVDDERIGESQDATAPPPAVLSKRNSNAKDSKRQGESHSDEINLNVGYSMNEEEVVEGQHPPASSSYPISKRRTNKKSSKSHVKNMSNERDTDAGYTNGRDNEVVEDLHFTVDSRALTSKRRARKKSARFRVKTTSNERDPDAGYGDGHDNEVVEDSHPITDSHAPISKRRPNKKNSKHRFETTLAGSDMEAGNNDLHDKDVTENSHLTVESRAPITKVHTKKNSSKHDIKNTPDERKTNEHQVWQNLHPITTSCSPTSKRGAKKENSKLIVESTSDESDLDTDFSGTGEREAVEVQQSIIDSPSTVSKPGAKKKKKKKTKRERKIKKSSKLVVETTPDAEDLSVIQNSADQAETEVNDPDAENQPALDSGRCPKPRGRLFAKEEDKLIVQLREEKKMSWAEIATHMDRRYQAVVNRYHEYLKEGASKGLYPRTSLEVTAEISKEIPQVRALATQQQTRSTSPEILEDITSFSDIPGQTKKTQYRGAGRARRKSIGEETFCRKINEVASKQTSRKRKRDMTDTVPPASHSVPEKKTRPVGDEHNNSSLTHSADRFPTLGCRSRSKKTLQRPKDTTSPSVENCDSSVSVAVGEQDSSIAVADASAGAVVSGVEDEPSGKLPSLSSRNKQSRWVAASAAPKTAEQDRQSAIEKRDTPSYFNTPAFSTDHDTMGNAATKPYPTSNIFGAVKPQATKTRTNDKPAELSLKRKRLAGPRVSTVAMHKTASSAFTEVTPEVILSRRQQSPAYQTPPLTPTLTVHQAPVAVMTRKPELFTSAEVDIGSDDELAH